MIKGHETLVSENALELMQIASAKADLEVLQSKMQQAQADLQADYETKTAELEAQAKKLNEDLEAKRLQFQKELDDTRAADLAAITANVEKAIADATKAQEEVETARGKLAADVLALKAESTTKHESLKEELLAAGAVIKAGAVADKAWAAPIIQQGIEAVQRQLDEALESHEALRGWIEPRPVDQAKIAEVIAHDLKTLNVVKEPEGKE